jgi:PAS domain S-box-containing protein
MVEQNTRSDSVHDNVDIDHIEQKRQEEALYQAEEKYRTVLEAIREAYYEVDLAGSFSFVNDSLCEIMGYAREELLGKNNRAYMDDATAQHVFQQTNQVYLTGQTARNVEWTLITKSDEQKYIEMSISLMTDSTGQPIGFRGLGRDITERKLAETEVQQAKEAAEAANRAKSIFLANMSHELRTPLNAIIGYSEMLIEDADDAGYNGIIPDLKKIQSAGNNLLDIINNLLDLSKIEAGTMELYYEPFKVAEIIDNIVSNIKLHMAGSGNNFQVECAQDVGSMVGDAVKVRQILLNLLSNAAKFTERGNIRLEVKRSHSDPIDWITFHIADTGIGMNKEQISIAFNAFTQADDSATRKYGGTGLGLAISRRFCQMMGGDIMVESEPGQGTAFTVQLPATAPIHKDIK